MQRQQRASVPSALVLLLLRMLSDSAGASSAMTMTTTMTITMTMTWHAIGQEDIDSQCQVQCGDGRVVAVWDGHGPGSRKSNHSWR